MLRAIDHINAVVRDIDAAVRFFVDIGFVEKHRATIEGEWVDAVVGLKNVKATFAALTIPGAETVLELLQYHRPKGEADPHASESNRIGWRHIALRVENIEETYRTLSAKGVKFLSPVQQSPSYRGKKLCYFLGPDDLLLEIAEYGDAK